MTSVQSSDLDLDDDDDECFLEELEELCLDDEPPEGILFASVSVFESDSTVGRGRFGFRREQGGDVVGDVVCPAGGGRGDDDDDDFCLPFLISTAVSWEDVVSVEVRGELI